MSVDKNKGRYCTCCYLLRSDPRMFKYGHLFHLLYASGSILAGTIVDTFRRFPRVSGYRDVRLARCGPESLHSLYNCVHGGGYVSSS